MSQYIVLKWPQDIGNSRIRVKWQMAFKPSMEFALDTRPPKNMLPCMSDDSPTQESGIIYILDTQLTIEITSEEIFEQPNNIYVSIVTVDEVFILLSLLTSFVNITTFYYK